MSNIVDSLYCELVSQGIDSQILVVCGRNETLKKNIDSRNWNSVILQWVKAKERQSKPSRWVSSRIRDCATIPTLPAIASTGCIETSSVMVMPSSLRRIFSNTNIGQSVSNPFQSIGVSGSNNSDEKEEVEEEKKCDSVNTEPEHNSIELDEDGKQLESSPEIGLCASERQNNEGQDVVTQLESGKSSRTGSIDLTEVNANQFTGKVKVVALGFVTRMAEYMVAADVLVSKAGPGTICEAAALALPVLLTSYLPGQEEGNVDFVLENKFGSFCSDKDPNAIGEELCMWLSDTEKMTELSCAAKKCGAPNAARDIVKEIGERTLKWKERNERKAAEEAAKVEQEQ